MKLAILLPLRVNGVSLPGTTGLVRLPCSCRVGDFTFWESLKNLDLHPPIVIKFLPTPPSANLNELVLNVAAFDFVAVWEFHRFDYIINGSLYHYYLRTK